MRLVLAIYSSDPDLVGFAGTSLTMAYGGGPYSFLNVYPPTWAFVLNLIGRTLLAGGSASSFVAPLPYGPAASILTGTPVPGVVVTPVFSLLEKGALSIFDLGTGLLLYGAVRRFGFRGIDARAAFGLWFLNPIVITVTAVHGDYDTMPVFFVLASTILLLEGEYLWAGMSLGIGVALKLYPLFLVPLGVALIVRRHEGIRGRMVPAMAYVFGAMLAGAVSFLPPGVLSSYLTVANTGATTATSFGGFWIWSVGYLPGLTSLLEWASIHTAEITPVILGITTAFALACAVLFLRPSRNGPMGDASPERFNRYLVAALAATYFSVPIVQTQYIVWVLPFLTLSQPFRNRWTTSAFVALSILVPAFYYLGFGGPLYFWIGLPVFTKLLSKSVLLASLAAFHSYAVVMNPVYLFGGFLALAACIGFATVKVPWKLGKVGAGK